MILHLEQISRLPERKHIIKDDQNNTLYNCGVYEPFHSYVLFPNNEKIDIITGNDLITNISLNGENVGQVKQKFCQTGKKLFIPIGYEYLEISLDGKKYFIYDIGLGRDKHFICTIDEFGQTVSIIHKEDMVENYLNKYTIYLKDEFLRLSVIVGMFLESTLFCDRTAGLGNGVEDTSYYTKQEELRNKYDAEFINDICKSSNHNNVE